MLNKLKATLRPGSAWRIAAVTVGAVAFVIAIYVIKKLLLSPLWSIQSSDRVVTATLYGSILVIVGSAALRVAFAGNPRLKHVLKRSTQTVATVVVVLTLYVAYASFRNQIMLAAEDSMNQEWLAVYALEMEDPGLRCLYDNYGHHRPSECLAGIVSNEKRWSSSIFYVEEVWSILLKARADRLKWGSNYSTDVESWAEDVSKDPTGLFTYYAVTTEGVGGARALMDEARVCVPDICKNYERVRGVLIAQRVPPNGRRNPCVVAPIEASVNCAARVRAWAVED